MIWMLNFKIVNVANHTQRNGAAIKLSYTNFDDVSNSIDGNLFHV